mgnify:CR=1 FL=1
MPVEGLLVVGHPEALRGQDPVVREVPEPAAAAPGAVVAEDETLELLPGEAVVLVVAVLLVVVLLVVVVPANQPKTLFPGSSLSLLHPPFPFLFP